MKRAMTLFFLIAAMLLSTNAGGLVEEDGQELRRVSRELGVDVTAGTLSSFADDHGGFHGDGTTRAVVELDGLEEQAAGVPGWRPLPMTENALRALRLLDKELEAGEGWYYLCDRHSQSTDPYDDGALHGRASWNFTLAVYDSGENRLYFYKLDT